MTREEAIHKMEYSKRAYQMLIDENVQEGVLVGQGINAEWSADTPIIDAYKDMLEACDMAIKALEQEPSGDLISRQAVLDALYALCDTGETLKENPWRDNPHIDALVDAIEDLPSVNPQESKTGHWIDMDEGFSPCECSECKSVEFIKSKYCPNCGARMESEE